MRIDARTSGEQRLQRWAEDHEVPFIGALREAQIYVRCVERGLTLFDLPASRVQTDLEQWQPILQWLAPLLETAAPSEAAPTPPRRLTAPAAVARTAATPAQRGRAVALAEPSATGLRRWLGWLLPPRSQARL
jgi:chromosome partitioning protein